MEDDWVISFYSSSGPLLALSWILHVILMGVVHSGFKTGGHYELVFWLGYFGMMTIPVVIIPPLMVILQLFVYSCYWLVYFGVAIWIGSICVKRNKSFCTTPPQTGHAKAVAAINFFNLAIFSLVIVILFSIAVSWQISGKPIWLKTHSSKPTPPQTGDGSNPVV